METRTEIGESERLSAWLATATTEPAAAVDLWRRNPNRPRCLLSGIAFDAVLADRRLVELAYDILRRYGQPLGPAVLGAHRGFAAVLVPYGTEPRWNDLMATVRWAERLSRPTCLGRGQAVQVPPLSLGRADTVVRWLEAPDDDLPMGSGPLLTSPAPLARCLAEARSLLPLTTERTTSGRTVRGAALPTLVGRSAVKRGGSAKPTVHDSQGRLGAAPGSHVVGRCAR
ncbi:hypothetical protein RKE29_01010 [Streptomyces sp. B1866]|uniref:hypothetical protein n=1 Tax=Streptomyces sp. B1866 TaxID=3075431 RepID=UPI0028918708|nr:hypothetical protein [Streptomyces sp. B1866]MDT3395241.1 hypothetical protein [Streptomyces sp. B1866]